MADKTLEISLSERPENSVENPDENFSISLEINPEDNSGKNSFLPADVVKIRLFSSSDKPYTVNTNQGSAGIWASRITFTHIENLTFSNSDTASLSYKPVSPAINYSWIGRSIGSVTINGSDIKLSSPGTGILQVSYAATYDILYHSLGGIGSSESLVWVDQGSQTANISIQRNGQVQHGQQVQQQESQEPSRELIQYDVTVLDYTTNDPVIGAEVYIDGNRRGVTDQFGKIRIPNISLGGHSILVIKSGYFSTDQDGLNNDSFVVSQ